RADRRLVRALRRAAALHPRRARHPARRAERRGHRVADGAVDPGPPAGVVTGPRHAAEPGLLRGTGPGLGPRADRLPYARRTLLHVLAAQAQQRPDQDWLVFDGRDRLTFHAAQQEAYRFAAATRAAGATTVALLLRNQREFMPAFLGAQAA